MNSGELCDLIELYAHQAGVTKTRLNRKLVRKVVNEKLKEFSRETGYLTAQWTDTSVASTKEYALDSDCVDVSTVTYDGYEAFKITYEEVNELAGTVS